MKKALLILSVLFICSIGFGQTGEIYLRDVEGENWDLLIDTFYISVDTICIPSEEEQIKFAIQESGSIVFLMMKYKEYCYNDSSIVSVYNACSIPGCAVSHGYRDEYFHKQPTFEGFMEWLNTKY